MIDHVRDMTDRIATPPISGNSTLRTRFAPSPTGYLHLGHVVNAIYVWGIACAAGGRVLLRLEDHDRRRCRPEYEAAILEDLEWLGFEPDEGRRPLIRQSERGAVYEDALARLRTTHRVYACTCSRKENVGGRYGGRCRRRALTEGPGRGLRVCIDAGTETFTDLLAGASAQNPAEQSGDLLVRDRDGQWTYHFAVTVDDLEQHITHVIRGSDLLDSTGRQLRLRRMLGGTRPPRYGHHPLIMKPDGKKLSKSAADSGVRELRRRGFSPAEVIGLAAAAVGLVGVGTPVSASEAGGLLGGPGEF